MITDEIKNKNYSLFKKKLEGFGVEPTRVDEIFGDTLVNATYAIDTNSGLAFEGSLLHTVLRTLTPFAIKLNDVLPEAIKVNQNSLVKVCLLQHLAKAEMFMKNDNQWEVEKLGKLFKYNNKKIALRLGMRSVALAIKLGIELTDIEIEAMTIIDKDSTDEQAKFFANPISVIVRQANELTTLENIFK